MIYGCKVCRMPRVYVPMYFKYQMYFTCNIFSHKSFPFSAGMMQSEYKHIVRISSSCCSTSSPGPTISHSTLQQAYKANTVLI